MSEKQARHVSERAGCKLLHYQEAVRAVLQLPDSRKIEIVVGPDSAKVRQAFSLFHLLVRVSPIGSWRLASLRKNVHGGFRPSGQAIRAAVLDALIENLSQCRSLHDAAMKASTGALDPFERVCDRLDAQARKTGTESC